MPVSTAAPAPSAAPPAPGLIGGLDLTAAFRAEIPRVAPSPGYIAALALVAAVMVVLPIVYLAIVGAAGLGTYWWATNGWEMVRDATGVGSGAGRGRGRTTLVVALLALFFYATPLIVGGVLVLFMIKPVFAPRAEREHVEPLYESAEPLFHAYVQRLCEVVGAPVPSEIVVDAETNASAGFRHGLWSLLTNDLRLRVGLPLVASMNAREFTGVLAHELGHFAQGGAMRLHYITQTINGWLWRIVMERDAWDIQLVEWYYHAEYTLVKIVSGLCIAAVWVARLPLFLLMLIAHTLSCVLLRRMEYNADTFQTRVAGSEAFESGFRRLTALGTAESLAAVEVRNRLADNRLPDNYPSLVAAFIRRLPPERIEKEFRTDATRPTRAFDSHPSTGDRIRAAQAQAEPGVCALDVPATKLFTDFESAARAATHRHFSEMFGGEIMMITFEPTARFLADAALDTGASHSEDPVADPLARALTAEVAGVLTLSPLFLDIEKIGKLPDPAPIVARLAKSRKEMRALRQEAARAARALREADDRLDGACQAATLIRAGIRFKPQTYGLDAAKLTAASRATHEATDAAANARASIDPYLDAANARFSSALRLLAVPALAPHLPDAAALAKEAAGLLEVNAALRAGFTPITAVGRFVLACKVLLNEAGGFKDTKRFGDEINRSFENAYHDFCAAHAALESAAYPFPHPRQPISVARAFVPSLPEHSVVQDLFHAATALRDGYSATSRRVLTRLIEIAQTVEAAVDAGIKARKSAQTGG